MVFGGNWRFEDPDGLVQDVQLKLLQMAQRDRIREPGAFQKLVTTVAKRTCVDQYYAQRRRSEHEAADEQPERIADENIDVDRHIEQGERLETLRYIVQRLPEACRELWDMVYREKLSATEVGQRLGITANNVRVRVHRCLQKARDIYSENAVHLAG